MPMIDLDKDTPVLHKGRQRRRRQDEYFLAVVRDGENATTCSRGGGLLQEGIQLEIICIYGGWLQPPGILL